MSKIVSIRLFVAAALVLVLMAAGYGFANTNTVPASYAGDGNNTITGFTITNVHYTLAGTPSNAMSSVDFTLAPAPGISGTAYVSLDGGTTWQACTLTGANASCANPGVTPLAATSLRIVAAD